MVLLVSLNVCFFKVLHKLLEEFQVISQYVFIGYTYKTEYFFKDNLILDGHHTQPTLTHPTTPNTIL